MDDFTREELDQLMAVFRDQAALVLEDMSQDILVLETNTSDAEAMARLRRAAHTIKGDSACVGLEGIADLAHRLEDIIEASRTGALNFDSEVVNLLLESLDEMRAAICGQDISDIAAETLHRLLESIRSIEEGRPAVSVDAQGNSQSNGDKKSPPASSSSEAEQIVVTGPNGSDSDISRIAEAIARGRQVFILELSGDLLGEVRQRLALPDSPFKPLGEKIVGDANGEHSTLIVETGLSPESVESWLKAAGSGLENGHGVPEEVAWVEAVANGALVTNRIGEASDNGRGPAAPAVQEGTRQRRSAEYVRVEAVRIDTLLNLAGEMVIARSAMNQVLPDLEAAFPKNDLVARFSSASVQMGKLIAELQKSILKMRMVPIDQVFRRFNRPMRELAMESGKQIELEVTGAETELDRTLIDLIYEPLLHLLRNAVDHGLEWPDEREAAGKPRAGKIRMRAYHEGNQVVVEVADDGRGIDLKSLRERAVESGEITQMQAGQISDDEALDLIFRTGLSTAREITRVSGRGIGMSAVKTVIEDLRGSITVKSEPGQGTTFTLRMPLTLAIIRALLFKVCGQVYALPLLVVSEVARSKNEEMVYLDNFESFRLRDHFISVVRPGRVFGIERRTGGVGSALRNSSPDFFIIVVSIGGRRFGIVADSLIGEQELVIKPLDSEWVQNDALAGASLLGDGRVVLILDAGAIFRKALKYEHTKGVAELAAEAR